MMESRNSTSPPTPVAAFWRGVNIGPHKRLPMAELRGLLTEMGFTGVRTLLNSGNAVFGVPEPLDPPALATVIREAVHARIGTDAAVQVVPGDQMRAAIEGTPIDPEHLNPSRFLIGFLTEERWQAALDPVTPLGALAERDWGRERLAYAAGAVYIWSPDGVMASEAHDTIQKLAVEGVTFRNWNTLQKVAAALEEVR